MSTTTAPHAIHEVEEVTVDSRGTLFATCTCGSELFARYSIDPGERPTRSSDGAGPSVEVYAITGGCVHLRSIDFEGHERTADALDGLAMRTGDPLC